MTRPVHARRRAAAAGLAVLCSCAAGALPVDEQAQFADGLYARGMNAMAAKEYMTLLREAPDYPRMDRILYRLGECHRRQEQAAPANLFFSRVVNEHGGSEYAPRAALRMAELSVDAGRYAEALSQFQALRDRSPPRNLAGACAYYTGLCLARTGRGAEAEKAYRDVIANYQDTPYYALACMELAGLLRDRKGSEDEQQALYRTAAAKSPTKALAAEAWFQVAELAFLRKAYAESAEAYAKVLTEHPQSPRATEARLQAGWAYYHAGRFADALALAETAPTSGPARGDAWLYLKANAQRQLLDSRGAADTYRALITRYPQSPLAATAGYESALLAFQQKDYDTVLRVAGAIQPTDDLRADVYWLLAESYAAKGDTPRSVQYFKMIVDSEGADRAPDALYRLARTLQDRASWAEASAAYRRLAREHPRHALAPQALSASGYCLAQQGDFREALVDWTRLQADYPDSPLVEEALFQKGLAELRLDRNDPARQTLAQLFKRFPGTRFAAEARYGLSLALERLGEAAEAEAELRRASVLDPPPETLRRIQYRLASLLQKEGKLDEAAGLLKALLATPTRTAMTPALMEWLARYTLDHEDYASAAQAAQALVDTADATAWRPIGYYLLGRCLMAQQRTDDALAAFEQAVVPDGPAPAESVEALRRIGDLLRAQQRYTEAERSYERAAERADRPALMETRARSLYGLGRLMEAQEQWDRAVRFYLGVAILYDDPGLAPECLSRAAAGLARLGRTDEENRTRAELAERYPDSEWARKPAAP